MPATLRPFLQDGTVTRPTGPAHPRRDVVVTPALAGLEPVSKHPGPGEQQSHIDELHLSRTIAIAQT